MFDGAPAPPCGEERRLVIMTAASGTSLANFSLGIKPTDWLNPILTKTTNTGGSQCSSGFGLDLVNF